MDLELIQRLAQTIFVDNVSDGGFAFACLRICGGSSSFVSFSAVGVTDETQIERVRSAFLAPHSAFHASVEGLHYRGAYSARNYPVKVRLPLGRIDKLILIM